MALTSQQLGTGLWQALQAEGADAAAITKAFLTMIEEQRLVALLPHVVKQLQFLHAQHTKQHTLRITVARKQSDAVIDELTKKIGTVAAVETTEDESLIGGFVAQYNNKVYDGSVATQLRKAEQILLS